jgi:hypothetical protein
MQMTAPQVVGVFLFSMVGLLVLSKVLFWLAKFVVPTIYFLYDWTRWLMSMAIHVARSWYSVAPVEPVEIESGAKAIGAVQNVVQRENPVVAPAPAVQAPEPPPAVDVTEPTPDVYIVLARLIVEKKVLQGDAFKVGLQIAPSGKSRRYKTHLQRLQKALGEVQGHVPYQRYEDGKPVFDDEGRPVIEYRPSNAEVVSN